MPGFLTSDGAELAGGKLPSGVGQALNLDSAGNLLTSVGGNASVAVAAGTAADTVVKNTPGRLARILVTATGANQMNIFDNASGHTGTQIGLIPANPTVGQIFDLQAPAANGITVQGNAANPGVTIFFS